MYGAGKTTLARVYTHLVKKAQMQGYSVSLLYFWLNSPKLAIERVKKRVISGGHNIQTDVIIRRYSMGMKNLKNLYAHIVDYWILVDNSQIPFEIIANADNLGSPQIYNHELYKIIMNL